MAVEDRASLLGDKSTTVRNVYPYPRIYIINVVNILYLFGVDIGHVSFNQYLVEYFKEKGTNSSKVASGGFEDNRTSDSCEENSTHAQEDVVQKESAHMLMYFRLVEYAIGIPSLILFGILLEIYGRKILMILSLLGTFLKQVVIVFAIHFGLSINWMYLGHACHGVLGSAFGFYMCCAVCIADVTDTGKSRSFQLALLTYFQGIGLTASQISAGYIIAQWGFKIPLIVSACAILICMLLLAVFMKETFNCNTTTTKVQRSCGSISTSFLVCCNKGEAMKADPPQFMLVLISLIVVLFPIQSRQDIDILYLLGSPFCFSSKAIGWFEAARELIMLNIGTGVLKLMLFCIRDEVIAILGCLSGILCYCGMALAANEWMLYAAIGCGILNMVPVPLIKAIYSKMVREENQGSAFASIFVIEALCSISSSTLFLNIYAETRSVFKGMVYLIFCAFNAGCVVLLIFVMICKNKKKSSVEDIKINVD